MLFIFIYFSTCPGRCTYFRRQNSFLGKFQNGDVSRAGICQGKRGDASDTHTKWLGLDHPTEHLNQPFLPRIVESLQYGNPRGVGMWES